jgi:hypothetical protein
MRFEKSNRTPYLGRRDQFRLAMMVVLIGFVLLSIEMASRESTWYWLTGNPGTDTSPTDSTPQRSSAGPKIDFNPRVDDEPLPLGVIRVEKAPRHSEDGEPVELGTDFSLAPEQIARIRDNAVGIRSAERDVYHDTLARVREIPLKKQQEAARDDVAFAVLMTESQEFIGRLITVKGEIRRLIAIPPGRNDHGIEDLWEAVMFNADSGSENPYLIRFTKLPEGIPTGMQLQSGTLVEVTGYYFKRFGYPTHDHRLHVAPMVLARTLKWFKPRSAQKPNDLGLIPYVLAFAAIIGTTIGVMLYQFRSSDRKFEREHLRRLTEAPREAIAAIDHLPVIDVGDALRQMSQFDRATPTESQAAKPDPESS